MNSQIWKVLLCFIKLDVSCSLSILFCYKEQIQIHYEILNGILGIKKVTAGKHGETSLEVCWHCNDVQHPE